MSNKEILVAGMVIFVLTFGLVIFEEKLNDSQMVKQFILMNNHEEIINVEKIILKTVGKQNIMLKQSMIIMK
ncbi:hypothetical protein H1D32_11475 [Anaerobacillus sp. CMMVII]|uniref:hypothetical protein n=1 Tax=Anaerobacillus sp. CMMVII TaxID=2755588 RepID=UPI0021B82B0F|nr:hypothetical protein [Anaerobacillus sp. CMMVII]MCT8138314.1 hypothetical protein [Anaerobacillus sp. CMMVII]